MPTQLWPKGGMRCSGVLSVIVKLPEMRIPAWYWFRRCVEELNYSKSEALGSTMLTGDGSHTVWKDGIMKDYDTRELSSDILMAAHHGSLDFFDDPSGNRYETHIRAIAGAMAIVSVGPNNYGHPDPTALRLYEKHSSGSNKGNKVLRTDKLGTMKLTLKSEGGWSLS